MAKAKADEVARVASVLSVPTRVRIIDLLRKHPLCVGALARKLDVTQGAVSQHLRVLRDHDVVIAEKRGYYTHYRLNEKTVAKWKAITERFLQTPED